MIKKHQIVDVYPEGVSSYRGCVKEICDGVVKVINLETGKILTHHTWECDEPIIDNILTFSKNSS